MNKKEQEINVAKKKNRKTLVVGIIAIIVIFALAVVFISVSGSKDRKLKETLHLAEQYLNELDYEKAIAAYEDAINIDPKCIDAYIGIADIYVAMSDEAESNSDYENAIKNCNSGLENLNRALNLELNDSETITAKIDEITTKRVELQKKLDEQLVEEQKKLEEEQKAKEEEEKKAKLLSNDSDLSLVQVGDTVYFGHKDRFSLSWTVLEVQNDKVLLLADSITKCEAQNIDKNLDFEKHFYDEEWEIILSTQIDNTTNSVPKGFEGDKSIVQEKCCLHQAKNGRYWYSPDDNGAPDLMNTSITSYELDNSTVNEEEVYLFFLSYDEAKKYSVYDCILRNMIHEECDNYVKPYNNEYKEWLENQGYEYDSIYGYHTESVEADSYAYVDSELNLTFLQESDKVNVRPAMWVKIN